MEDKPKHDLPKIEDTPNSEYRNFLERTKIGKPSFDAYVESLSQEMQTYDAINPYKKDALKEITNKADAFLRRHVKISYEDVTITKYKPEARGY